jgi:three-Cys-motif partner protein
VGLLTDGDDESLADDDNDEGAGDPHYFGGAWTRIKLDALEKYLVAFNTALSKQSFIRFYIDAFAGTGRCDIKVDGEKKSIDGSARRALAVEPSFHKYFFIELRPKKLTALNALGAEYPEKTIEVIKSDANAALKAMCGQYQWRSERAVLFLDPFGMHVEWATLEAIVGTGAIDVWYLFPYAGLYRQAAKNANALDADKVASMTRVLGTDEWRRTFYVQNPQSDLFGGDNGDVRDTNHRQMLEFVSKRLKSLFPAVTDPKVLYQGGNSKNPGGAPLFALYFAVSNPKPKAYGLATKIAQDILGAL